MACSVCLDENSPLYRPAVCDSQCASASSCRACLLTDIGARVSGGQVPMCISRTHQLSSIIELIQLHQWRYLFRLYFFRCFFQAFFVLAAPVHAFISLWLAVVKAVMDDSVTASATDLLRRTGMILWFFPIPLSWMLIPLRLWNLFLVSFPLQYIVFATMLHFGMALSGTFRNELSSNANRVEAFLLRGIENMQVLSLFRRQLQTRRQVLLVAVLPLMTLLIGFPSVFISILWNPRIASLTMISIFSALPEEQLRSLQDLLFRAAAIPPTPRERGQWDQFLRDEDAKAAIYRHCPQCRAPIARIQGCMSMICGVDADSSSATGAGCLRRFNWSDAEPYVPDITTHPLYRIFAESSQ